jgi:3-hydroxyisobutyrate dehydrogenase-like beta-hydroxyacid dehydrogenase
MKLVVNLVLGLNRAALAEGLAFAKSSNIDPAKALEVLRAGVSYSAVMDTKGLKMISGDFSPQARLSQHRKDVAIILDVAEKQDLSLPLSATHFEILQKAEELGLGELDNSAIVKVYSP